MGLHSRRLHPIYEVCEAADETTGLESFLTYLKAGVWISW